MTTFTDDIGLWNRLGSVIPQPRTWLKFPTTATGANNTFRVRFLCDNWPKLASYILIRPRYITANTDQVGLAVRIYPEQTPIIFDLPISLDLRERNILFRDIEIKKVRRRRARLVGISPDTNIEVYLEELWG